MGASQRHAVAAYRERLDARGLARFEVLGRVADRQLIRALARILAEDRPESRTLRAAAIQAIGGDAPAKGGILAALRRSPLIGAELELSRSREAGRDSGI